MPGRETGGAWASSDTVCGAFFGNETDLHFTAPGQKPGRSSASFPSSRGSHDPAAGRLDPFFKAKGDSIPVRENPGGGNRIQAAS